MNKINRDFPLYGIPENVILEIEIAYNEEHRYFHTCEHINSILKLINQCDELNEKSKKILTFIALFHDIIYDVCDESEALSAVKFAEIWCNDLSGLISYDDAKQIALTIIQTSRHDAGDPISKIFNQFDCAILMSKDIDELIDYENKISKEYSHIPTDKYIEGRCEFLSKFINTNDKLIDLINFIKSKEYGNIQN